MTNDLDMRVTLGQCTRAESLGNQDKWWNECGLFPSHDQAEDPYSICTTNINQHMLCSIFRLDAVGYRASLALAYCGISLLRRGGITGLALPIEVFIASFPFPTRRLL